MVLKKKRVKFPRYNITHKRLNRLERLAHSVRNVERYAYIRQGLSGKVIDAGCGVGYGTYMIAMNPDVKWVVGIDNDKDAINIARREYRAKNLTFVCNEFDKAKLVGPYDWMVAVEIIEHLRNPKLLANLADRFKINKIILTYPSKKTTHYNPFHFYDYTDAMVKKVFRKFKVTETYDFHATHDTKVLFLRRK